MSQNAVIYARFSSTEQALGHSLERQISHGERFVLEQGWTLDGVITDEARSAFHGKNRVLGSSLHEFEENSLKGLNRGAVLCVENVDRLSRQGAKESIQLIWKLNEAGVDVATWHDGKIYKAAAHTDLLDLFTIALSGQRAFDESQTKSRRSQDSWTKRYENISSGEKITAARAPAWIKKVEGAYELDADRTRVLNEIFDWYVAGRGIPFIVQTLNGRGEPGWASFKEKSGKPPRENAGWYLAYVHRLLTHRAVLGEYVTLRGETLSADYFPQAINADKFNAAQEVRGTRKVARNGDGKKANNLLTGIVICNACGGRAGYERKGVNRSSTYVTKAGVKREYFVKSTERLCCDNNRRGKGCSNRIRYDYRIVEQAVLTTLVDWVVDNYVENPQLTATQEQIAEQERHAGVAQGRLDNLVDALADGGSRTLLERITGLERELDERKRVIADLKRNLSQIQSKPSPSLDVDLLAKLQTGLESDDLVLRHSARHQTNMALKRLVESVTISEHNGFALVTRWGFWEWDEKGQLQVAQDFA